MFARVAVVGCGLIGGSFALALRQAGRAQAFVGFDRDAAHATRAKALGIVDEVVDDLSDAVRGADCVVVATPVAAAPAVFGTIATSLAPMAIVTDVGSTKGDVIDAARGALGAAFARFVPGHPIAGREVHGPEAARADLFRDRRVLLTPVVETDRDAVDAIADAWTACGAKVERIDAAAHDRLLSTVSHLPHLLAYLLVAQVADGADAARMLELAGGGFRDFTRIAASSPAMWRDIAIANRDALLADLDDYGARLAALRDRVAAADRDALEALFARAAAVRGAWREGGA